MINFNKTHDSRGERDNYALIEESLKKLVNILVYEVLPCMQVSKDLCVQSF